MEAAKPKILLCEDDTNLGMVLKNYLELNDYEAFTEKLLCLIENENKRQKMSQKGWSFVQEKFQYKTLIAKTDSYYKFLLNQKNL